MSEKITLGQRIRSGWWVGLSQFDLIIWIETALIALVVASFFL